ncbi:hypothetical protein V865_002224 [Kwoniella europaea PYCC6329]|uniref:Uncharacterized protein n=1 Tax=Kwoniella europaea PYCC6329 TaxID=1423913 RepID=A0AAX4KEE4_9TREE
MSTRSNYLLSKTPLYSLMNIPPAPLEPLLDTSPLASSSEKLPTPRQRTTRKSRARGLSILIPPPTQDLQKVKLVITYQSAKQTLNSKPLSHPHQHGNHQETPLTIGHYHHSYHNLGDEVENIQYERMNWRFKYPGLIFVCIGLVMFGFTILGLLLIIPAPSPPPSLGHLKALLVIVLLGF